MSRTVGSYFISGGTIPGFHAHNSSPLVSSANNSVAVTYVISPG
jgi:hypothetical protein